MFKRSYNFLNYLALLIALALYLWRDEADLCRVALPGSAHAVGRLSRDDVALFTGIPYAKPPVGDLRFRRPVFRYVRQGEKIKSTKRPASCLQNPYPPYPKFFGAQGTISEDCLYLNIFTRLSWIRNKKPVIFYIHGGSFSNGDGISRDGTGLVANKNVLFVSINYRIQMMGFLNYGEGIPKNIGLYDITTALEWVQEYIAYFGGNKNKVTILGESAGGALVTYLYASPLTKDLFQQAISLSGALTAPWSFPVIDLSEQISKWDIILRGTGCINQTEMSPVECLRNQTEDRIKGVMNETLNSYMMDTWAPVVDDEIIPSNPDAILDDIQLKRPLLSGLCQDEGTHVAVPLAMVKDKDIRNNSAIIADKEELRSFSINHPLVKGSTLPCLSDNGDALLEMYVGDVHEGHELKEIFGFMMGDILLFCPQIDFVTRLARSGANVYQFIFNYRSPTARILPEYESWQGVQHNFDMAYELGYPYNDHPLFNSSILSFGKKDRKVSRIMMDIFHSFAANGKPRMKFKNSDMCLKNVKEENSYLHLLNHKIIVKPLDSIQEQCNKMKDIINKHRIPC